MNPSIVIPGASENSALRPVFGRRCRLAPDPGTIPSDAEMPKTSLAHREAV
jgi:hypothetical protein